jgi:hypothetical protein
MKTEIRIEYYPSNINFSVNKALPDFKFGCQTRRKLLISAMKKMKVPSPVHAYEDYIVEAVKKTKKANGQTVEVWYLGS